MITAQEELSKELLKITTLVFHRLSPACKNGAEREQIMELTVKPSVVQSKVNPKKGVEHCVPRSPHACKGEGAERG